MSECLSSKKSTNIKCWGGYGEKKTLAPCWWECKVVHQYGVSLKKLKTELSYDPAIPLLGMYLVNENTDSKRYIHLNSYLQ